MSVATVHCDSGGRKACDRVEDAQCCSLRPSGDAVRDLANDDLDLVTIRGSTERPSDVHLASLGNLASNEFDPPLDDHPKWRECARSACAQCKL